MAQGFRTQVACRITGIDRDRFNEAVHAGYYPCAPKVRQGATRVFDEDDLVVLFLYQLLLKDGLTPKQAGREVCAVRECLRFNASPGEAEVLRFRTSRGDYETYAGKEVKETPRRATGGALVWYRTSYDIENIRTHVLREIERENEVVGPDDEG